jgi:hypothetical protein
MAELSILETAMDVLTDSYLTKWFETPDPDENEFDNVWSDFHVFNNEWQLVQNRKEWYESPNVPQIYKDHKYIFDKNMEMGKPEETFYYQNIDSNEFASDMFINEELPSGRGDMRLEIQMETKYPPSGENDFAMVEYQVDTLMKYDMPRTVKHLPRILALPLAYTYRWLFMLIIAEEMVHRDGEYAIERGQQYYQYLRKYHGEEPSQTKTNRVEFTPLPEDGIFFE